MRVLLDDECAAVAGGHESQCVKNVTTAAIATGIVVGAAAGGAAGGVGGLAGAVAGAGVGSLMAQIVAGPLCRWAEGDQSEEEADYVEPELQDWHDNQYAASFGSRHPEIAGASEVYAPHDYVADGASY